MRNSGLLAVYFIVFLDMLGFGILIPLLRDLTEYLVKNSALSWPSHIYMGALMASYSGAQMLSASFIGRMSDIYGRRPVLLVSCAGNVLSYVIWTLSTTYWPFLLGRVLSGATGGNIAIAQSIIADQTEPHQRARAMGLLGACIGLGFVLGPILGYAMININQIWQPSSININQFWAIGGACFVLATLSVLLALRIPIINNQSATRERVGVSWITALGSLFQAKTQSLYGSYLLSQISFVIFEVLFAWVLKHQYGFNLNETYLLFIGQGVFLAIVQGGIYRRIEAKKPPKTWVNLGLALSGICLLILPWVGFLEAAGGLHFNLKIATLIAALILLSLALGFASPAFTSFASLNAPKNEQGQTMGNLQALAAFARFSAPLAATGLYAVAIPLPFYLAGAAALVGLVVFRRA